VQLAGRKGAEGMTGDGIAVAANIAEFAATARLLASRAFRDALAVAKPGAEAALVPGGTYTDAGLRAHEVFGPDERALARRRRRYTLASAVMLVALFGGGIGWRATHERAPLMASLMVKYPVVADFVRRVRF
jgi:hypothetical protein